MHGQPPFQSRTNIQKYNGFAIKNPAEIIHVPYHNAYTVPARLLNGHHTILSLPHATINPSMESGYNINTRIGNSTVGQLLQRNKNMSNQYNPYPFYNTSDPSTMWTAPNEYFNINA